MIPSLAALGLLLVLLAAYAPPISASKVNGLRGSLSHARSKQLSVNDAGLAEANGE
jgi:hypothetical protein